MGKAKRTIAYYRKALKWIAKHADLQNPEAVALEIARCKKPDGTDASNSYKAKLATAYNHFCKLNHIQWEKPIYTPEERGIQPPTEEQVKILISGIATPMSIKIQISAETGLRPIEVTGEKGLRVKDFHADQKTITALNTKRCLARPPMKLTEELTTRLQTYIKIHNLQPDDLLFKGKAERYERGFRASRNKLAKKLGNPELKKIRLYDLRHFYVTKQLRRIQNCEIVRQIVGHKKLNTTQKYMHLLAGNSGEWIVEGTTDKERVKQLLAEDFTYQLTTPDGTMMFRKPK
jgi:integrase